MAGIGRDKRRVKQVANVDLITPYGTEITVGADRAEALLKREPIAFADGTYRKYAESGEDNVVEFGTTTKAKPPRTGTGANSGGE